MSAELEVKRLADYLLSIGGPAENESAVDKAIRLLEERRAKAARAMPPQAHSGRRYRSRSNRRIRWP
jgi:hypothetical protein